MALKLQELPGFDVIMEKIIENLDTRSLCNLR